MKKRSGASRPAAKPVTPARKRRLPEPRAEGAPTYYTGDHKPTVAQPGPRSINGAAPED